MVPCSCTQLTWPCMHQVLATHVVPIYNSCMGRWAPLQVLYSKFGFMYTDIKLGEQDFILIREDDVIAVMPRSSKQHLVAVPHTKHSYTLVSHTLSVPLCTPSLHAALLRVSSRLEAVDSSVDPCVNPCVPWSPGVCALQTPRPMTSRHEALADSVWSR